MQLTKLFAKEKPFIACIHLMALPGAPLYGGKMEEMFEVALREASLFQKHGFDGVIIENFRDRPFFPERVPAETIAAMTAVGREIVRSITIPVGINVLRNDAESAISIATAIGAQFIRVNVHMNAVVADQGIIQGVSYRTARLRSQLKSDVLIFADVGVKHASPLAGRGLAIEAHDLSERGLVDGLIVSGDFTGSETNVDDLSIVKEASSLPVLVGSGVTPENLDRYLKTADGFIVGSCLKKEGKADNFVDEKRVRSLSEKMASFRSQ